MDGLSDSSTHAATTAHSAAQRTQLPTNATAPSPSALPQGAAVTVAQLIAWARNTHPTADAIAAAQAAAAAELRQARAWDNPEFSVDVGRRRPRGGTPAASVEDLEQGILPQVEPDSTVYGGSLNQRLQWWGKRQARTAAARARLGAATAEAQLAYVELDAEVQRAAIAYGAAQIAAQQSIEEARLSKLLAEAAASAVAAGEGERAQAARARLDAMTAGITAQQRQRAVATALAVLRTWCGPDVPDELAISDVFENMARSIPTATQHPRLAALAAQTAAADADVAAERATRVPDLTLGIFGERDRDDDTVGVSVGIEIPLWNQNQGGIAIALAEQARIRATARVERLRLQRDLTEAEAAIAAADAESEALATLALPAAEEIIRLRDIAFQHGSGSLSELLEARRAAQLVRSELLAARVRAALARVDLSVASGGTATGVTQP
jgi:cobalt-zinc-cadmium efflux system outer membrane protein